MPRPAAWVFSTYFAEGLPYMIVRFISSVFFTDLGVREAFLGLLNFLGIPWNLKFLWAPFLDLFETKRSWLLKMQGIITLAVFVMAILAGLNPHGGSTTILSAMAFLFVGLAFMAATHDIAIDAYYLEGLTSPSDQAAYSGLRVLAYRIAIIYARSVIVAIAGVTNWCFGFTAGGATMLVLFTFHLLRLPRFEAKRSPTRIRWQEIRGGFLDSFRTYLQRDRVVLILCFIALYKMGDEILFSMNTPFLMRELGVSKTQLAWLAGLVGSFATIGGTLLGAWWIKKWGLKRALWPLTLLMNINILAYLILSEGRPMASTLGGLSLIAMVHAYENMAGGLGTAALMVYLMRLCHTRYKAAHFAIGTAIMSLGSSLIGGFGGIIVENMGYTRLFLLGFLAAIPSMILLKWLPLETDESSSSTT